MPHTAHGNETILATTSELAREARRSEGRIRQLARAGALPVAVTLSNGMRLFDRRAAAQILETLTRRTSRAK
jgi:hypothetical protein